MVNVSLKVDRIVATYENEKAIFDVDKDGLLMLVEYIQVKSGGHYVFSSDFNHPDEFPNLDRRVLDIIAGNYKEIESE